MMTNSSYGDQAKNSDLKNSELFEDLSWFQRKAWRQMSMR